MEIWPRYLVHIIGARTRISSIRHLSLASRHSTGTTSGITGKWGSLVVPAAWMRAQLLPLVTCCACGVVPAACAMASWHRTIAIAPAAGPTGIAALGELRNLCREERNMDTLQVRALCRDAEEEVMCRRAVCGARVCEGSISDLCHSSFPSLETSAVLPPLWSDASSEILEASGILEASLSGCTTLLILLDDIHPVLNDVAPGEQVVMMPTDSRKMLHQCLAQNIILMDAAASAGVDHIILHSALGAADSSYTHLQTVRMGGAAHLSLRRELEEHLKRRLDNDSPPVRHTILRAAPYATTQQLADRRLAVDSEWRSVKPPLTSPEVLARAAIKAALYTRPNTLERHVTREVVVPA